MKLVLKLTLIAFIISVIASIGGTTFSYYAFKDVIAPDFSWFYHYLIIVLGVVIFVMLVFFFVGRSISGPLTTLSNDVDQITKGKLDVRLKESNVYEINKLVDSLNRILASLKLAVLKTGIKKSEIGLGEAIKDKEKAEAKAGALEKQNIKLVRATIELAEVKKQLEDKGIELAKAEQSKRFAKLSEGRELKMIELKKRIKELESKLKAKKK